MYIVKTIQTTHVKGINIFLSFMLNFPYFSDSRPVYANVNDTVDDMNSRLQNWDILIRNIKSFYVVSPRNHFIHVQCMDMYIDSVECYV